MDSKTYVAARRNGLASRSASSSGRPAAISLSAAISFILATAAAAQTTQPDKAPSNENGVQATQSVPRADNSKTNTPKPDEALTEIVITGVRASLASAQAIKQMAPTVVDAITAEDIGALPDRSVVESLQRVPGVTISKFEGGNDPDHFSAEGTTIQI